MMRSSGCDVLLFCIRVLFHKVCASLILFVADATRRNVSDVGYYRYCCPSCLVFTIYILNWGLIHS